MYHGDVDGITPAPTIPQPTPFCTSAFPTRRFTRRRRQPTHSYQGPCPSQGCLPSQGATCLHWQDASCPKRAVRMAWRWCQTKNDASAPDLNFFSGMVTGSIGDKSKGEEPIHAVIGLPRLSFPLDQSHGNCLLPDTNQLFKHPVALCPVPPDGVSGICSETPVGVCVLGGGGQHLRPA